MSADHPRPEAAPAPAERSHPAPPSPAEAAPSGKTKPVSELTPEEQMERFAAELKEQDWGHQPC